MATEKGTAVPLHPVAVQVDSCGQLLERLGHVGARPDGRANQMAEGAPIPRCRCANTTPFAGSTKIMPSPISPVRDALMRSMTAHPPSAVIGRPPDLSLCDEFQR